MSSLDKVRLMRPDFVVIQLPVLSGVDIWLTRLIVQSSYHNWFYHHLVDTLGWLQCLDDSLGWFQHLLDRVSFYVNVFDTLSWLRYLPDMLGQLQITLLVDNVGCMLTDLGCFCCLDDMVWLVSASCFLVHIT